MTFDLENFLPYRLYQAAEQTSQAFYSYYKDRYGLGRSEWRVLFNIGQYGPISAVEISRRSNLEKTKISRAVQKLEEREWLRRVYKADDRRRHNLELTDDGRKAFEDLVALAATFDAEIRASIGSRSADDLLLKLKYLEASYLMAEAD